MMDIKGPVKGKLHADPFCIVLYDVEDKIIVDIEAKVNALLAERDALKAVVDAACRYLNHEAQCTLPYGPEFYNKHFTLVEAMTAAALKAGLEPFSDKYLTDDNGAALRAAGR